MCEFCGCDDKRIVGTPSGKRKSPFPVIGIESKEASEGHNVTGSNARPQADTHEGRRRTQRTAAKLGQPAGVE